ncbi:RNA-binding S4 domain-containing protein [Texcoconibacillus texcoconensis]|nr:RNA-binding S4 domain-containing protein [Texcoconibacillus texcoconensis]
MRIDKFLKVSRLIKRRTLAKEVASKGRIVINGNVAKAGSNVDIGDEIAIRFGQKKVTLRVERLESATKKEDAEGMYTLLKEEFIEADAE